MIRCGPHGMLRPECRGRARRSRCRRYPHAAGRRRPIRSCRRPSRSLSAGTSSAARACVYILGSGLPKPTSPSIRIASNRARKVESIDLPSLSLAAAVGEQCQPASLRAHPLHSGNRVLERPDRIVSKRVIRFADASRQLLVIHTELGEREADDLSARPRQLQAAGSMALGIRPVPLAQSIDGVEHDACIEAVHARLMCAQASRQQLMTPPLSSRMVSSRSSRTARGRETSVPQHQRCENEQHGRKCVRVPSSDPHL